MRFIIHRQYVADRLSEVVAPNRCHMATARLPLANNPLSGGSGMPVCNKKSTEIPANPAKKPALMPKSCSNKKYCVQ